MLNSRTRKIIHGDYEKLSRVMNNLVVNAMKFSPAGSEIAVEANASETGVAISVKDNGIGIPANMQNQIFDPFTASRRKGTDGEQPFGLGLYISKQIIEAHGGKIWPDSEVGKGTTFHVELPLN
jgi:signal transduction histidine kinase